MYKSPLIKKTGDLQWRVLHGAIAVNAFVSLINSEVTEGCPFCLEKETIFHAFMHYGRLKPLFDILRKVFDSFNEFFSMKVFICRFKYVKKFRHKCQLLNFLIGQAKMVIYTTRKEKIEQNVCNSLVAIFIKLVKSRILIDSLL